MTDWANESIFMLITPIYCPHVLTVHLTTSVQNLKVIDRTSKDPWSKMWALYPGVHYSIQMANIVTLTGGRDSGSAVHGLGGTIHASPRALATHSPSTVLTHLQMSVISLGMNSSFSLGIMANPPIAYREPAVETRLMELRSWGNSRNSDHLKCIEPQSFTLDHTFKPSCITLFFTNVILILLLNYQMIFKWQLV